MANVKRAAEVFQSKESRLDVLFNDTAAAITSADMKSAQGYEMLLATNCLGPLLFTLRLLPFLQAAAKSACPGTVRVVWSSSQVTDMVPTGSFQLS